MILAGHQPVYLPGIIVMAKIALADQFMWVGHCDYQPKSFHSRNFIRGNKDRTIMLSVPVVHKSGPSINEKLIDGYRWKDHQLKTIQYTYAKRPYFHEYFPSLSEVMQKSHAYLGELNTALVSLFCQWLEIKTPIVQSADYQITARKTAMLVQMCEKVGATEYLSSPGEVAYVDKQEMNGFEHRFQKFKHPVYPQGHRNFMPDLSVIDLVFNCGPESADLIRKCHEE